jgi:purine-binding chemotaxis protein CheW
MSPASDSSTEPAGAAAPNDRDNADLRAVATEFISFAIGDEQYGVDIMVVREIKGWSSVTQLPNQPDYMRGALNLRGVMVPIVDLRCRFGQGLTDTTPMHVVMIVRVGSKTVGLLADRVLDIVAVDASQIQPVPQVPRAMRADFLSGLVTIDTTMIALIDLDHLLSEREIESLATA